MGAFILFPIFAFILFMATVMGVTDYVHAETLVHAAAQTAVAAAAQDVQAPTGEGDYTLISAHSLKVDSASALSTVRGMLGGSGTPYISKSNNHWSKNCGVSGIHYTCVVDFSVSMPFLGHVNGSTTASASILVRTKSANTTPSGPPNIPIFSGSTTTLNPGWSIQGGTSYAAGSFSSPANDGGWLNGNASYKFKVASGQPTTLTYGIPAGGLVNNGPASISINGVLQTKITSGAGGGGQTTPAQQNLWSYTFGPGTYTVSMSGGSINVYGLWASNLSAVTSTHNFFPAGSLKSGLWQSTPGNCDAYDPSQAKLGASMQQNAYNGMPAMALSGSYGNACETHAITMPHQLVGGDTFLVRLAAQTQGPLFVGPSICIWDSQANECLPASWSPSASNVSQWTVFNVAMSLPKSYRNGNNLTLYLYSGGTNGGQPAVNAYSDIQMFAGS